MKIAFFSVKQSSIKQFLHHSYSVLMCELMSWWSSKPAPFSSSRPEVFRKKGVALQLYLKKGLWHRCFPVNFAKFLRTSFLPNTSGGCFWPFTMIRGFFWLEVNHSYHFILWIYIDSFQNKGLPKWPIVMKRNMKKVQLF